MNKLFRLGLTLTLSLSTLAGCAGNIAVAPNVSSTAGTAGNYSLASDTTATGTSAALPGGNPGDGMRGGPGGGPGMGGPGGPGGGPGMGGPGVPGGGFGDFPPDLNLTADQKTQLEALRQADKPVQPSTPPNMADVKAAITTAFEADTFDEAALKVKLDALKPTQNIDAMLASQADYIIKSFNILTADQKTLLETQQAAMAAKVPPVRPTPDPTEISARLDNEVNRLATDLGLDDTQKASIKALLQSTPLPDPTAEMAKGKAAHDAVNAALKAGNATVDSLVAILKANAPADMSSKQTDDLDRLAKIHDILTAAQRKTFLETGRGFPGGPGDGPGGPGMGGPGGGPGGKGGRF